MSKGEKKSSSKTFNVKPMKIGQLWLLPFDVFVLWFEFMVCEFSVPRASGGGGRRETWAPPLNSRNETRWIWYYSNVLGAWRWKHVLLFLGAVTLGMTRRVENAARRSDACLGVLALPLRCPDMPSGSHLMTGKQNIQTLGRLFHSIEETLS